MGKTRAFAVSKEQLSFASSFRLVKVTQILHCLTSPFSAIGRVCAHQRSSGFVCLFLIALAALIKPVCLLQTSPFLFVIYSTELRGRDKGVMC